MAQSSVYPILLGRSFAFVYQLSQTGSNMEAKARAVRRFAEQISRDLPPPGTLRNEAMSRHLNLKWQVAVTRYEWTTFSVLLKVMSQITGSS